MIQIQDYFQEKLRKIQSSKAIQISLLGFLGYILLLGLWFNSQMTNAVALEVNGKQIAVVSDQQQAQVVLNNMIKEQEKNTGQKVELKEQITYTPVKSEEETLPAAALKSLLAKSLIFTTDAVGIKVDSNVIATVQNREVANEVIEALKKVELSSAQQIEIESVVIEEDIQLVNIETKVSEVVSKDKAIEKLKYSDSEKNQVHKVVEGESLWTVAHKYDLTVDELIAANPNIDPGALQIDHILQVKKVEPVVNVLITAKTKVVEELPYETEVKRDSNLARGKEKIEQQGEEGKVENTYKIVFRNNIPAKRELLEAKTLEEPKPKIVVRGSKNYVVASRSAAGSWAGGGSGNFGWPAQGRITSPFGDGRGHSGIDLANRSGTGIYAAADGVVVFSAYGGGYGNHIDIDHGNGYVTRYAHNSSNLVSVGERVSRGQLIAYMGSTGRSTGSHVHFEIRSGGRWGTPLNPVKFLR